MRRRAYALVAVLAVTGAAIGLVAAARQNESTSPRVLTDADYARAEKMLAPALNGLVLHGAVNPQWHADDTFTYVVDTESGLKAYNVDPAKASREETAAPARGAGRGRFGFGGGRGFGRAPESTSPDGKTIVFIKDWNLWARDAATKQETQLTTDGVENFGYATDNAGWSHSDRPIVLWSPDSRRIATFQQDQRGDGENYLVSTPDMSTPPGTHHPVLEAWKFPLPGDKVVTTIRRVVIALDPTPHVIRFQMPPDQHRSTDYDDVRFGPDQDVQWSADGSTIGFISTSRDHKQEDVRVADAASGAVRNVYEEKVATYYEGGQGGTNFRYLPESNEFIWFSERSGWGQLYLYDLTTGQLKNQITHVDGQVTSIRRLDAKNRVIYFYASSSVPGENPYYIHLYRVNFDGSDERPLTPENANHTVSFAPSGKYFVDSYSTPVEPPVSVLRDADGKVILPLEKADISRLKAAGWVPPIQVKVKGRDGATDIYGLMFAPSHRVPGRKYPIVNHIYPGPQTGSVGSRNFSPARGDDQALAELGFVVVELDGMGTPWRGKKFHDAYYGHMEDNTLPDQVIGMKELAQRYPYIDINRAGIFGHSGGGDATAGAMFHYPDFFKVGIAESGNHDQGLNEDDWGEKWQGLVEPLPDGKTTYSTQGNENYAANLKGHLMLAHGTMDTNVLPEETMLIVDALIKANKDFDLIMLPNQNHGYGPDSDYMMRRRWDYFVCYLAGATPPKEYKIGANAPARGAARP